MLFLFLYLIHLPALLLLPHQTAVSRRFNQCILSVVIWIIYPHNTLLEQRCSLPIFGNPLREQEEILWLISKEET